MTTDGTMLLHALRATLAERVGAVRYEVWLGAGQWISLEGDSLVVSVPNEFYVTWIRRNLKTPLEAASLAVLGKPVEVILRAAVTSVPSQASEQHTLNGQNHAAAEPAEAPRNRAPGGEQPDSARQAAPALSSDQHRPLVMDGRDRRVTAGTDGPATTATTASAAQNTSGGLLRPLRRPRATLDDFFPGQVNRICWDTAQRAAQLVGEITPVIFFGPTGTGKSHLVEAIAAAIQQGRSARSALFVTGEQFTCMFQAALHGGGMPSFRRKFRQVDALLLDDLHFLRGKRHTGEELLLTIDALVREGKQVVLTTSMPFAELGELGAGLASRVQAGMFCKLAPPDYEARRGIVARLVTQLGYRLSDEVQAIIARNITGSARELLGAVHRLQATSRALARPMTPALAQETLEEMIQNNLPVVRIADVERAVCKVFDMEPSELHSDKKAREIAYPRMLAMFLSRRFTRSALTEIGAYFGRRSHSTVLSAERKIRDALAQGGRIPMHKGDRPLEEVVQLVEERLRTG